MPAPGTLHSGPLPGRSRRNATADCPKGLGATRTSFLGVDDAMGASVLCRPEPIERRVMENTRRATRPRTRDGARRLDDRARLRDADGVDRDRRPRGRRWRQPTGCRGDHIRRRGGAWFAHAYASVLGHRATDSPPFGRRDRPGAATRLVDRARRDPRGDRDGWGVAWLVGTGAALGFANAAGIAVLAAAGWTVARAAGEGLAGRLTATIVTASIGVGIVAVEMVAHR